MTERKCFVFRFADIEVREREFLLIKAGERVTLTLDPKRHAYLVPAAGVIDVGAVRIEAHAALLRFLRLWAWLRRGCLGDRAFAVGW